MISPFGVKIGGGSTSCLNAEVKNSSATYVNTVASGGTLILPDITVTDSDGSTFTAPSVENITCTPASPAPVGFTLMKTGKTTSYTAGDDGDTERGRATSFTVLASNNPFGNTNRFTSKVGTQVYTDSVVIDWSTYNGSTVLAYYHGDTTTRNLATHCTQHLTSTFNGLTGWYLTNFYEFFNITNFELTTPANMFDYAPFNISQRRYFWHSSQPAGTGGNCVDTQGITPLVSVGKTNAYSGIFVRVCTVTGTNIT